ncbi:MAG: hypothetical protein R2734_00320 [Nocardioides sp.]
MKSSGVIRRTIGHVQAVDVLRHRRRLLGLVGESGCGQVDDGQDDHLAGDLTGGSIRSTGRRSPTSRCARWRRCAARSR